MRFRIYLLAVAASFCGVVHAQVPAAPECVSPKSQDVLARCLARELRESDARINDLYKRVMARADAPSRAALRDQQRDWIRDRDNSCHVTTTDADRERWYAAVAGNTRSAACVTEETRYRIAVLEALNEGKPEPSRQAVRETASAATQMASTTPDAAGKPRLPTFHSEGKWYFEVTIDREAVAKHGGTQVMAGFMSPGNEFTGVAHEMLLSNRGPFTIGCAIDLDEGMVYFHVNGNWSDKAPGSNRGMTAKLGREYGAQVRGAERIDAAISNGWIKPNFGDTPFAYPLPAGYRSWR
jgi:uncharacterized protein YecT (DUF1311 family)